MRRLLATGVGLSFALTTANAVAQSFGAATPQLLPASPLASKPATRILAVRPLEEAPSNARGQTPAPMPMPMPAPVIGAPGQGLPMPRPFGKGPTVSEVPGATAPGAMIPGQTYPYTPSAPMSYPQGYPQGGVTLGPAIPVDGGAMPTMVSPDQGRYVPPALDAPLFGGSYAEVPGGPGLFGACATNAGCDPERWWSSAEYLMWWTKSAQFPALLTTSSPSFNGILGTGDTRTLVGNGSFGQTLHSGGRFGLGRWFGNDQRWALDGSVFFLGRNGNEFAANSDQYPLLARPFNNANQNIPFSEIVSANGLARGGASVQFENSVWGADVNLRRRLAGSSCSRLDVIGGFQYLSVSEELRINEFFSRTPDSPRSIGVPTAIAGIVTDRFRTENEFYGATLGLQGEVRRGRWFTNLTTKIALGTVHQTAIIEGNQQISFDTGTTSSFPGGLLAVPGNIGQYTQNKFAVVPQVGLNIGYHVTPNFRVFMGYNFMYLSSVLRPGNQIDTNIDVTRIPNFPVAGATTLPFVRPTVPLKDTDFFTQGLSFGMQWKW